jgi:hypothetical protein
MRGVPGVWGTWANQAPPFAPFAPRLTKGWQFNALITATSGSPFNITAGRNNSNTGENKDRPKLDWRSLRQYSGVEWHASRAVF